MATGPAAEVKAMIEEILAREEFKDRRAARMDLDDNMGLLAAFNEKGLHFS